MREGTMRSKSLSKRLFLVIGAAWVLWLFMSGTANSQQGTWTDEIANSITLYKSLYPASNFKPYNAQLTLVKEALGKGDNKGVRTEMRKWFKMLRKRAHGIEGIAADELLNVAVMVTPLKQYNISVPRR